MAERRDFQGEYLWLLFEKEFESLHVGSFSVNVFIAARSSCIHSQTTCWADEGASREGRRNWGENYEYTTDSIQNVVNLLTLFCVSLSVFVISVS